MPRTSRICGWLLLNLIITGCGSGSVYPSGGETPPPHKGELVQIPDGKGYVEFVRKPAAGKSDVSGEVTFYFLKDMNTPYSPSPGKGTLKTGKKTIELKSEGDALVTPNGPPLFAKKEVDGSLQFELEGTSVTVPLGVR